MSSAGLNKQNDGFDIVCIYAAAALKSLDVENKIRTSTFENGTPILPTTTNEGHQITIDDENKEAFRTVKGKGKIKLKNYKEIKIKHAEWKKREEIKDRDKDQDQGVR